MIIKTTLRGKEYTFETKAGIFSSDAIDEGTQLLIENISLKHDDIVLDLGCGYGAIGIVAADLASNGKVYMVDVDVRAVKFSILNSKLNKTQNVDIRLSDGFESLSNLRFDVILSHLPTHVSKAEFISLLEESKHHLKNSGNIYVVFEKRIAPFMKRELKNLFGNYTVVKTSSKHIILLATNSSTSS